MKLETTPSDKPIAAAIEAAVELGRLALSSHDPAVATYARAFFEAHCREACKMIGDIQRHSVAVALETPEPFNAPASVIEAAWRSR